MFGTRVRRTFTFLIFLFSKKPRLIKANSAKAHNGLPITPLITILYIFGMPIFKRD
jgi:hypothetical protein